MCTSMCDKLCTPDCAARQERERIIKLLESEYALAVERDFEIVQGLGVAIALIKGENK